MTGTGRIGAIVVLYRMTPDASPAVASLSAALSGDPASAQRFMPMLFDNTPGGQILDSTPWQKQADPTNPGLAAAYQWAAEQARQRACDWVLMLDQDTKIPPDYPAIMLRAIDGLSPHDGVDILVPRLVGDGRPLSPHWPARLRSEPLAADTMGIVSDEICAFNSGLVLRLSAIERVGGFPADFPLDYLDHAMMLRLQQHGSRSLLLPVTVRHDLSMTHDHRAIALDRYDAWQRAESRFYRQHPSAQARHWLRLRRLHRVASRVLRGQFGPLLRADVAALLGRRG